MNDKTGWFKSSYTGPGGNCVEVKFDSGRVQVRDSKLGDASPIITMKPAQWSALVDTVK